MRYFNNFFPFYAVSSVFIISLLIQIFLAIFVYKDSKKRGMEPILWTLIVIFVPNFIGLIIYLVIRSTHKSNPYINELKCNNCGTTIQKDWKVCPNCMSKLDSSYSTDNKENMQSNTRQSYTQKYTTNTTYNSNQKSRYTDFYEDGKKDNKALIIIIIVVVVFGIGLLITNFMSPNFSKYNSNIHIMSEKNESTHHIKKSFSYWDGVEEKKISIKEDGTLVVEYDLNCKKGSLYTALKDSDNKLVKTFPQNGNGSFEKEVKEGEIYYLTCKGEGAKGSLSFEFNVE